MLGMGCSAQSLEIHAGGHLSPPPRKEDSAHPTGPASVKDEPKLVSEEAPQRGSAFLSPACDRGAEPRVSWGLGNTGLCLAAWRRRSHTHTHTHGARCHQGGKASWQWGHPGWAAGLSAAPKLFDNGGNGKKNKTRCFFEHFWHS